MRACPPWVPTPVPRTVSLCLTCQGGLDTVSAKGNRVPWCELSKGGQEERACVSQCRAVDAHRGPGSLKGCEERMCGALVSPSDLAPRIVCVQQMAAH